MYVQSFLQLGTNKGNKLENLENAMQAIKLEIGNVVSISSIYETEPWGYQDNETYFNQVVKVRTHLKPNELLKTCMGIEKILGRVRTRNEYESRTMDIDILFYGNEIIKTEELIVPHPRLHERNFVLSPMVEIESDFIHPIFQKTINELHKICKDTTWIKLKKNLPPNKSKEGSNYD
jgi:2-amino-4-hydroxy-6-hydroxymethyldihydropteridine diphosphokinase